MAYQAKNYENLIGVEGLSEQALKTHIGLYEGYVKNANKLDEILKAMEKEGRVDTPEFAELKRRFGWEFNGMRLHEYYFGSFSKTAGKLDANSSLVKKIVVEWGSFEEWEKDFASTASSRGIGWTILYYDRNEDRMFNAWINEHDLGHLAGCFPILVIDVFEHAYMLDYGTKRADYIQALFKIIDWPALAQRFDSI